MTLTNSCSQKLCQFCVIKCLIYGFKRFANINTRDQPAGTFEMTSLKPRKQKKILQPGPIESKEGVPYDYIVVIDAGSKGSRVYIYNWLNPLHVLNNDLDFYEISKKKDFKLVRKFFIDNEDTGLYAEAEEEDNLDFLNERDERDTRGEGDETDVTETGSLGQGGSSKVSGTKIDSKKDSKKEGKEDKAKGSDVGLLNKYKLPVVRTKKKWSKKIKPGISSFNSSPQKIGNHHIKHLLQLASAAVPKSQHSRTPIFLHSTGGMRLLTPKEQQQILENICSYITQNSDFFIPECSTHVNVIDGDVEGLYGWLSINYLIGAFDNPQDHAHGKNHTTYGLLDMGGASTQVVFQPNSTEIDEHQNNLFKIKLLELPSQISHNDRDEGSKDSKDNVGNFHAPSNLSFDLYSDSFLGYGMYQAHNKYLSFLAENYTKENELDKSFYSFSHSPVPDPCLPKGYTTKATINEDASYFTGESDFNKCLTSIFPVLHSSTYSTGSGNDENCKEFKDIDESSSCLLNDLIPAFDFDVNHFIGVSGYWDAITNLLLYNDRTPANSKKVSARDKNDDSTDTYDYKVIYKATSKICSQSWSELIELNNAKSEKKQLAEDELSELCFKSSWILNFLHLGLGFPRFGIDEHAKENNRYKSLELVEKLGGSTFSWTLGRAILYANDEYAQAFNNFTADSLGLSEDERMSSKHKVPRSGFYHSASSSVFHFGAEQSGIISRPQFTSPLEGAKYPVFDYETEYQSDDKETKWYIEPHRWYGSLVFLSLIVFIVWLMVGKRTRTTLVDSTKSRMRNFLNLVTKGKINMSYLRLDNNSGNNNDLELADFELPHTTQGRSDTRNDNEDQFKIDSDED